MKTTLVAAIAVSGAALSQPAFAQTYIQGGYTFMQSEGSAGGDVSLNVATVRVGHEILPFIAIEGEASTGISDGHYQVSGSAYADVTLKSQVGIFAVGRLPVPAVGTLFARAGYANTNLDDDGYGYIRDGNGVALGAGIEFDLIPGLDTRLEYTQFGGTDAKSVSLSAGLKF